MGRWLDVQCSSCQSPALDPPDPAQACSERKGDSPCLIPAQERTCARWQKVPWWRQFRDALLEEICGRLRADGLSDKPVYCSSCYQAQGSGRTSDLYWLLQRSV